MPISRITALRRARPFRRKASLPRNWRQPQFGARGDQGAGIGGRAGIAPGHRRLRESLLFEPLLENLAYGLGDALRQIEEVTAIRRALEVGLIDKTLELIGEDDIRELRDTLEKMRQRAERGEGFPEEDRHFHQLLFRCQDNEMLLRLIEVFWLAFYKASNFMNLENIDPITTWRDHVAIVDAIEAGDVVAVRKQLDRHYSGINQVIALNRTASLTGRKT